MVLQDIMLAKSLTIGFVNLVSSLHRAMVLSDPTQDNIRLSQGRLRQCYIMNSLLSSTEDTNIFQHKVPINHEARQISESDFTRFTHILASDGSNLRHLERIKPSNSTADIQLWGSFLDNRPIPDPYYGGMVSHHTVRYTL